MATREENLKKINEELEMLSDDELEKISGGTWGEMWSDANKFKDEFGIDFVTQYKGTIIADMEAFTRGDLIDTFAKFGVKMEFNDSSANKYYIKGKEVTRDEAWNQVKLKLGK